MILLLPKGPFFDFHQSSPSRYTFIQCAVFLSFLPLNGSFSACFWSLLALLLWFYLFSKTVVSFCIRSSKWYFLNILWSLVESLLYNKCLITKNPFICIVYMYVHLWRYIYLCAFESNVLRGQSTALNPLGLELQVLVNRLLWVLGTEPWAATRAVWMLNHCALSSPKFLSYTLSGLFVFLSSFIPCVCMLSVT